VRKALGKKKVTHDSTYNVTAKLGGGRGILVVGGPQEKKKEG